jgi:PleD family two-component response regulator
VAPLRVLAVDDDPILRTLLEKLLVLKGYQVRVAKDGREGLRLTIEFAPQIIITDWKMPEMDGLAMCRALRGSEEGEKVYIILLTAQETEDALVEAFDAGADDYIVKPFNKRVLMARLRAGERIIRLHKVLEQTARTEDLSCRLGGEEFLVICPETGLKAAQTVAERIR